MESGCLRPVATHQMSNYGDVVCTELGSPISAGKRRQYLDNSLHTQKSKERNFHKALNILNCSYYHGPGISQYIKLPRQRNLQT